MSLPTLNLKTATPDEINLAIAVHVVGWKRETRARYAGSDKVLGWGLNTYLGLGDRERGFVSHPCQLPDYLTDANAILPLLYRTHREVNQTTVAAHPIRVVIYSSIVASGPRAYGEADNLPRAACIALLRASGKVTVLD